MGRKGTKQNWEEGCSFHEGIMHLLGASEAGWPFRLPLIQATDQPSCPCTDPQMKADPGSLSSAEAIAEEISPSSGQHITLLTTLRIG